MNKMKFLICFMAIILPSALSYAQSSTQRETSPITKSKMMQDIKDMADDEAQLEKHNPFVKGTKKYNIFLDYLRNLMNNDLIIGKLVEIAYEYKDTDVDIKKLFNALITDKLRSGVIKLSYADLSNYFIMYGRMLDNSESIDECAGLTGGTTGNVVFKALAKMDDDSVVSWLRMASKAVILGISDQSEPQTISKDQEEVAWQILFSVLNQRQLKEIARIMSNIETASKAEVCWYGVFVIDRLNKMKDEPKKWATHSMIKMMFQ
jgi:hypothetical protein